MLRALSDKVSPRHTALLVIDVQNDFCHANGEMARRAVDLTAVRAAVPRIDRLAAAARRARVFVVFVQALHVAADISDVYLEHRYRANPAGAGIVADGSWGAEFFEIGPESGDVVVTKPRYSAFAATSLETILGARQIRTVLLCGVTTEACVEATARDAFTRDYYVVVTGDGTATHDPREHEDALRRMDRLVGCVCSTDDAITAWGTP